MNFFANVDRRAKSLKRNLHDVDGSHNTGTKAARLEKEDSFGFRLIDALVNVSGVKSGCGHVFKYTASGGLPGFPVNHFRCSQAAEKPAAPPE
jgi:hypothetical protein